jgi:arylsulfatase A-like enzyme
VAGIETSRNRTHVVLRIALIVAVGWASALRGAEGRADVSAARAAPPNILFILADDLGIGDVSCYNPRSAWRTPQLDRLAAQGIQFTDAHAASALCTPSRYALLTGRYAWRGRLKRGVVNGYDPALIEPHRVTLPAFLRAHGYATAMFGKWHLGLDWARAGAKPEQVDFTAAFGGGPRAIGFERFLGIAASLDMPPYVWLRDDRVVTPPTAMVGDSPPPQLWRAGPIAADFKMEEVEPRLIDETIAYLKTRRGAPAGNPFFLYLPLAAPHTPLLPTGRFKGATHTTDYGDFVTQVDDDIGRVLAALEANGLAENTLVVVSSDNGFAPAAGLPELAPFHHEPSGGYRGYKSDLFEGGHRVPFLVRWPGHTKSGAKSEALVGQLDFYATCAELLGTTPRDDAAEDSVSFLAALSGNEKAARAVPRTTLVHHSGEGRFTIREGAWKLLLWPGSGGWSSPTPNPSQWLRVPAEDISRLPKYQLYDLAHDPAEQHNLAAEHPEIVQRLGRRLREEVLRGRSTSGAAQPLSTPWPELAWMGDFATP